VGVAVSELVAAVEIYEVEVEIRGNHQLKSLITKLDQYGFVKEERYWWGVDSWNRRRREKALFNILIRRERERAFKIMLTQQQNNTPLKITTKKLSGFF